jgi:hypothetical protein
MLGLIELNHVKWVVSIAVIAPSVTQQQATVLLRNIRRNPTTLALLQMPNDLSLIGTQEDFFCNPILFAICTSTFSKLCKNMYTVGCRRVLTSTPL